ncbi:MAG: hypothetical protein QXI12_12720 [Candidatus Methanomethyliaceae archaeon]
MPLIDLQTRPTTSLTITRDVAVAIRDETSENYEKLISAIKAYGTYGYVNRSTWIVVTDGTCASVRDYLLQFMHPDDRLFVASLSGEAAWRNALCSNQWLKDHL